MNRLIKTSILLFSSSLLILLYLMYPEIRRNYLLQKYSPSQHLLDTITRPGSFPLTSIMQPHEVKVCSMDSYGRPDELVGLTENQRLSLSKNDTPSEDGSWYLLFYSSNKINRIIFIGNTVPPISLAAQICGDQGSTFLISEKIDSSSIAVKFFQITGN